jgi:hypothetical protein
VSTAQDRIDGLIELAPDYTEAHNKVYKTPGHKASRNCPDCQKFDLVSGNAELLLYCENCGAGGIEDAQMHLENSGAPEACEQCIEFATLWDLHEDELVCYNWPI